MRLTLCPLATRYQYIAISKPTSRHLRDCSMLMRMLIMWSCFLPHLAAGLLVLLRLDVSMTCWSWLTSQFVVGLYQLCPFVVPRPFPSAEKRDKPSLTYISLKNSLHFAFPLEIWCLSRNERLCPIQSQGRLKLFLKPSFKLWNTSTVWFCFYIAFLYFVVNLLHL